MFNPVGWDNEGWPLSVDPSHKTFFSKNVVVNACTNHHHDIGGTGFRYGLCSSTCHGNRAAFLSSRCPAIAPPPRAASRFQVCPKWRHITSHISPQMVHICFMFITLSHSLENHLQTTYLYQTVAYLQIYNIYIYSIYLNIYIYYIYTVYIEIYIYIQYILKYISIYSIYWNIYIYSKYVYIYIQYIYI